MDKNENEEAEFQAVCAVVCAKTKACLRTVWAEEMSSVCHEMMDAQKERGEPELRDAHLLPDLSISLFLRFVDEQLEKSTARTIMYLAQQPPKTLESQSEQQHFIKCMWSLHEQDKKQRGGPLFGGDKMYQQASLFVEEQLKRMLLKCTHKTLLPINKAVHEPGEWYQVNEKWMQRDGWEQIDGKFVTGPLTEKMAVINIPPPGMHMKEIPVPRMQGVKPISKITVDHSGKEGVIKEAVGHCMDALWREWVRKQVYHTIFGEECKVLRKVEEMCCAQMTNLFFNQVSKMSVAALRAQAEGIEPLSFAAAMKAEFKTHEQLSNTLASDLQSDEEVEVWEHSDFCMEEILNYMLEVEKACTTQVSSKDGIISNVFLDMCRTNNSLADAIANQLLFRFREAQSNCKLNLMGDHVPQQELEEKMQELLLAHEPGDGMSILKERERAARAEILASKKELKSLMEGCVTAGPAAFSCENTDKPPHDSSSVWDLGERMLYARCWGFEAAEEEAVRRKTMLAKNPPIKRQESKIHELLMESLISMDNNQLMEMKNRPLLMKVCSDTGLQKMRDEFALQGYNTATQQLWEMLPQKETPVDGDDIDDDMPALEDPTDVQQERGGCILQTFKDSPQYTTLQFNKEEKQEFEQTARFAAHMAKMLEKARKAE